MKYFTLLLLLLGSFVVGEAQITAVSDRSQCGTPLVNRQVRSSIQDTHVGIISTGSNVSNYCVSLKLHRVTRTNGMYGLTEAQILNSLNNIDARFVFEGSNDHITFNYDGVEVVNDDYVFDYNETSSFTGLFDILPSTNDAIDIYFFDEILTDGDGGSVFGVADGIADGTTILISNNSLDADKIAHEIGHVLGLFHTYHGTRGNGSNNPENADHYNQGDFVECEGLGSSSTGDFIMDTPGDPGGPLENEDPSVEGCDFFEGQEVFDYCGDEQNPGNIYVYGVNLKNFMRTSASEGWSFSCWESFTPRQGIRMKGILGNVTSNFDHINAVLCSNSDDSDEGNEDNFNCDSAAVDAQAIIDSIRCQPGPVPNYSFLIDVLPEYLTSYSDILLVTSKQIIDIKNAPVYDSGGPVDNLIIRRYRLDDYIEITDLQSLQLYGPDGILCVEISFNSPPPCRSSSRDSEYQLYPNPILRNTMTSINIGDDVSKVIIYDLYGKKLKTEKVVSGKIMTTINRRGIYLVQGYDIKGDIKFTNQIIVK